MESMLWNTDLVSTVEFKFHSTDGQDIWTCLENKRNWFELYVKNLHKLPVLWCIIVQVCDIEFLLKSLLKKRPAFFAKICDKC